jgi:uncharacterized protein (TIGR01777 family)
LSRVVIAGGTGLIGRALAKELTQSGYEVVVLSRSPDLNKNRLSSGVRLVKWDGRSASGWIELAEGAKAIINLAGANLSGGRWTASRKRLILQSRLDAGKAVSQAVEGVVEKPEVLVQASAVGYYGPHGDEFVTEETPPGNDFQASVCVQWEDSTLSVEKAGVRHVIVRTGVALSSQGGALPLLALPYRLFVGGPIGSGKQWFPWISLADEVAAIRFLIENQAASGVYNFSAPTPLVNKEFGKVLGKVLHRPSFFPIPSFIFKLMFGEMSTILLTGQREIPERLLKSGYKFHFPQAEQALTAIFKTEQSG